MRSVPFQAKVSLRVSTVPLLSFLTAHGWHVRGVMNEGGRGSSGGGYEIWMDEG